MTKILTKKKKDVELSVTPMFKMSTKYVSYDWISVYIEEGDLKRCRSLLRCSNGFYS